MNIKDYFDINEELLKSNIVRLDGEVNEMTSAKVCAFLTAIDNENPEKELEDGTVYKDPIWLYINSPGGSVMDGLAIIDTMQAIQSPVFTVCVGLAASMGAAILTCGDRRYATTNASIMFHEVSSGAQGKLSTMEEDLEFTKSLDNTLERIISENIGMNQKKYHNLIRKTDLWLNPAAALPGKFGEKGAIDVILKPKKKVIPDSILESLEVESDENN